MNNFLLSLGIVLVIFGTVKLIAYLINRIRSQSK